MDLKNAPPALGRLTALAFFFSLIFPALTSAGSMRSCTLDYHNSALIDEDLIHGSLDEATTAFKGGSKIQSRLDQFISNFWSLSASDRGKQALAIVKDLEVELREKGWTVRRQTLRESLIYSGLREGEINSLLAGTSADHQVLNLVRAPDRFTLFNRLLETNLANGIIFDPIPLARISATEAILRSLDLRRVLMVNTDTTSGQLKGSLLHEIRHLREVQKMEKGIASSYQAQLIPRTKSATTGVKGYDRILFKEEEIAYGQQRAWDKNEALRTWSHQVAALFAEATARAQRLMESRPSAIIFHSKGGYAGITYTDFLLQMPTGPVALRVHLPETGSSTDRAILMVALKKKLESMLSASYLHLQQ